MTTELINGKVYFEVSTLEEIKDLLYDNCCKVNIPNIEKIIEQINADINDYIYENKAFDTQAVNTLLENNELELKEID